MVRLWTHLYRFVLLTLTIVLSSMLLACVPPRLKILPPDAPPASPTGLEYDLSDRLPELLLAPPGSPPVRPASAALTDSLADLLRGEYAAAADRLADTLNRLGPGDERRVTADLLGETLFLLGDWDRFLHYAPSYSAGLYDDRVLAQTFSGQAPFRVVIPAEPVTLPLSASPIGTPALAVKVNGRDSRFWLDTGAGLTVLTESTAGRCGIVSAGPKTTADTTTRHKVVVRGAIIQELRAGDVVFHNLPAIVLSDRDLRLPGPLGHPISLDGLIGWNALRHMAVDLDLATGCCRLGPSRPAADSRRNLFWLGYPCACAATADGRPLVFGLDTGAAATSLRQPFLEKSGTRSLPRRRTKIAGAGGIESREVQIVPRLTVRLGGQSLVWRDLAIWPVSGYALTPLDGVLGADVLAVARLKLDPAAGRLILYPHLR
ncbi:MAG TPA: aspartyl protease family protein [Acidobacteriota bacterium]|nr:aspartyl protease family protein [Acidobacteriota bacterium]